MMSLQRLYPVTSQLLVLASLVLIPALWLAPPALWRLPVEHLAVLAAMVLSYTAASIVVMRFRRRGRHCSAVEAAMIAIATFSICVTCLVFLEWRVPSAFTATFRREALLTGMLIGVAGVATGSMPHVHALVRIGLFGAVALVGSIGHLAFRSGHLPRPEQPSYLASTVATSLYELRVEEFTNWIPRHWRQGGGVANWHDGYLLVTGNGEMYRVRRQPGQESLDVTRLPHTVPLNADEFTQGAREVFRLSPRSGVESGRFRVADVLVQELADSVRVLVSHHYWHDSNQCFVMRLSMIEGPAKYLLESRSKLVWRTLYETDPCLKLNTDAPRGARFEGLENGGRLALLATGDLLMTVGDHGFDGVNRSEALAQDPSASYGKIMRVDIATGESSMFTLGHRNPQGLFVDRQGMIWQAEHGPKGGDEINVIREGANYGWPSVTYGTDYSRHSWPMSTTQGRHEGYEGPIFAFVPSVGVSNLIVAEADRFERWRGDLLVGSLKEQALYRMRIGDGGVRFVEPIPIGRRIRDIASGHDDQIVIWTDDYSLIFIEPTQATEGDALVSQCAGCHGFSAWDRSSALGPNLHQVVGRRVASRTDFQYSTALAEMGGRWTRARLDEFLANPQAVAPGTLMPFAGIADKDQRERVIDYLEHMAKDD